jgi:hypothetical protein
MWIEMKGGNIARIADWKRNVSRKWVCYTLLEILLFVAGSR